jgi:DmsE family decaheme c-type cytochrome
MLRSLLKLCWILLCLALPNAAPGADSVYAGSQACRSCHPDVWLNFYKNPHARSLQTATETPDKTGCESCHGPGAAHVAAHGGKAPFVAFSQLAPREVLDTCLRCHANDLSRVNIRRSAHTEAGVVCTNCHSIHKPATPKFLLAKVQREVCYTCHTAVRAQFEMPVHHRVNEGVMECTDCHNPHGAFAPTWRMAARPRLVTQAAGNEEPCLKCHADKRGPFVFEHPAVRIDGCETCHVPHGSTNAKLLTRPVVFTMCLECHNGAGAFGRNNAGVPRLDASHNLLDPRYQHCTVCHVRIHGSNSDSLFLR